MGEVTPSPTPPLRFIGQGDVEASKWRLEDLDRAEWAKLSLSEQQAIWNRYDALWDTLATGRPG